MEMEAWLHCKYRKSILVTVVLMSRTFFFPFNFFKWH